MRTVCSNKSRNELDAMLGMLGAAAETTFYAALQVCLARLDIARSQKPFPQLEFLSSQSSGRLSHRQ